MASGWTHQMMRQIASNDAPNSDDHSAPSNLARACDTARRRVAAVAAFVALSAINKVGAALADSARALRVGRQVAKPPRDHRHSSRTHHFASARRRGGAERGY